jgi:hypothetical protein
MPQIWLFDSGFNLIRQLLISSSPSSTRGRTTSQMLCWDSNLHHPHRKPSKSPSERSQLYRKYPVESLLNGAISEVNTNGTEVCVTSSGAIIAQTACSGSREPRSLLVSWIQKKVPTWLTEYVLFCFWICLRHEADCFRQTKQSTSYLRADSFNLIFLQLFKQKEKVCSIWHSHLFHK